MAFVTSSESDRLTIGTRCNVPLRFFRHVIFRSIDDLLHHPEVVSGGRADLRGKSGRFLVDSIARGASSTEELASQRVEVGKTASLIERVTSCLKSHREPSTPTRSFKPPPTAR